MKKPVICLLLVLFLLLSLSGLALACTSFAWYGPEIYYGLNFDFNQGAHARLLVDDKSPMRRLVGQFQDGTVWREFMGYNEAGLFGTLQMVPYREQVNVPSFSASYIFPNLLTHGLTTVKTVEEVVDLVGNRRLIHAPGFYLHSLFADTSKTAVIAEPGREGNHFLAMEGDYLVVTNFYHQDLLTGPLTKAHGGGIDRYRTVDNILATTKPDEFNLETALQALKAAKQSINTRVFSVILPEQNVIYVGVNGDFSRVWKIDLAAGTLRNFLGLLEEKEVSITSQGITVDELAAWR